MRLRRFGVLALVPLLLAGFAPLAFPNSLLQTAREAPEPPPVEAGFPGSPGEYDLDVDIRHYDIELSLGAAEIEGRVTIAVETNGAAELPLDFTGLGIRRVQVGGRDSGFEFDAGKLIIPLAGETDDGAGLQVSVAYHGTPDDGLIIRDNIHGNATAFVDNWPNRTRFWLPSVDHPADKATASFTVHAPAGWQVIANGAPGGAPAPADAAALGGGDGKMTWRWATPVDHPTYTLVVGAAGFHVESLGRSACGQAPASPDPDGCIDVSFWAYPEDTVFAREAFRRAPAMVDFFTEAIGPYPFEKLANVQSATRFGGMENSSAIFYAEGAIANGDLSERTVSHEIAHQWFGDSATAADWTHLWLSEGFATYFGDLFFESADGTDAFRELLARSRERYLESNVADRPIVDPERLKNLFELLNGNNYQKGAWVLHMLRGILGDEAFFRGVRDYYATHEYGNALSDDLRRVLEDSSGEPLDWFFQQWVYQPGYPILESEWQLAPDGSELVLVVTQVQPATWPTFRVPMDVAVHVGERITTQRIELTARSQTLRLPVVGRPDAIVLDPEGWVLKVVR